MEGRGVWGRERAEGCKDRQEGVSAGVKDGNRGLTAASGASTYPANRDFEGHVGGCGARAPQRFFFSKKMMDFQEEKCDVWTKT